MRPATASFGIIAVLLVLWTGPLFHIHAADVSRDHNEVAGLHIQSFRVLQETNSGSSIEKPAARHVGFPVIVTAGSGHKARARVAEAGNVPVIFEPSILVVFGVDSAIRVHDAPSRQNSSPRSPPSWVSARF